jgi:hypothetical protein
MSKYGCCSNCGCTLEKVGCPNCDEITVSNYYDRLSKENENCYPDWSVD